VRHLRHLSAGEGKEVRSFLNRERKVLLVIAVAAFVAARLRLPICPFAYLTGLPCPGCGLSRAAFALFRGDVRGALAMHPLVFVALPGALVLALHATSHGRASALREHAMTALSATLLVLLIAVWLARFAGAFGGPVRVPSSQRGRLEGYTLKRKCITSPSWTT